MTSIKGTTRGFIAGENLLAHRAVKLSAGTVVYADDGEAPIGYTLYAADSGETADVQIFRPTVEGTAAGAFSAGATLYPQNDGKVDDVANGDAIGIALQAATTENDVVEILPFIATSVAANQARVEAKTATYAVTAGDSGKTFTNTGASGAVTLSLPAATLGLQYDVALGAAQELRLDPNGTETISLANGVQQAAGKYVVADAIGESASIRCVIAGQWLMLNAVGTWTAEA